MKILKVGDIVTVKHEGIEVDITPLTHSQKMEIKDCISIQAGKEVIDNYKSTMLSMGYSIKGVRGVFNYDDSPYQLNFIDDAKTKLTEDCTSELITAFSTNTIFLAITYVLANKIPEIEGVEIQVSPKK
jgi:hypothetical protein